MKVTNLTRKPFIIPVDSGKPFMLIPAGGVVELPSGCNEAYIEALSNAGKVTINEADKELYTEEELSKMHYKQVDVVAEEYGITTEGTKAETIELILEAQG